ncbi:hypothetical protein Ddye_032575 [Dipteronia dyeriana]|uniref:Glutaminyl-tRNA synthetase class Ib non-specific RNA-binding domain-containing protein n=1 Tax=Dipteronia dyeriana TaxID=168575 RepID=A0AAD9WJR5_9ROSI|nr:hypothetical protein Ddye_032575 [Dipteronia dyeriana]
MNGLLRTQSPTTGHHQLDGRHSRVVTDGCDRRIGNLLYTVATKYPANALVHRPALLKYIVSSKIKTPAQLEAAFSFFASIGSEDFKLDEFEEVCGVGVEVSTEDIERTVKEVFEENRNSILELRYRTNVRSIQADLQEEPEALLGFLVLNSTIVVVVVVVSRRESETAKLKNPN